MLKKALAQVGPWAGQALTVTPAWFVDRMRDRTRELDWKAVKEDVQRFLPRREQEGLDLWSADLFLYHTSRMAEYL